MAPSTISALSKLATVEQCAQYDQVVAPHLPQLEKFYENFVYAASSLAQLQQFYVSTNPLVTAFVFSLALAPIFLVASEINRNYSQVDRFWSILPSIYAVHYAAWSHLASTPTEKNDLVALIAVIWSVRLTFNYWRRGGYNIGSEDYRWNIIKAQIHPAIFFVFNVTFISTIQSVLLFSIHLPTYVLLNAARVTGEGISTVDMAFGGAMLLAVTISAISDQQQWNFHAAKAHYQKTARVPKGYTREQIEHGFNTTGLFAWSRHPNFAAEQSVWVLLYLWSAVTCKTWISFAGVGALSYLALFQGSTWLTELITSDKYADYKIYQQNVGRFIPSIFAPFTDPIPAGSTGAGSRKSARINGKSS